MRKRNEEFSILVYSCHRNSDMWPIFLKLFKKYWKDCPYNLLLLTDKEEMEETIADFDKVVALDSSWYNMLMKGIESAGTPYISLWMDDYLLCDYVNTADIEKQLSNAKRYNAANIRLLESDTIKASDFSENNEYHIYKPGTAYSFSTQVGIWDAKLLKELIKPEWSPWDFERIGSMDNKNLMQPLLGAKNYVFPYIEGVRRGKWMREGASLCKRLGIELDLGKRPIMSDFEMAWIYFKGGLLSLNPNGIQNIQNRIRRRK